MTKLMLSNDELLNELAKRLNANANGNALAEISRLEDQTRQLGQRLRESENGKSQFLSNVRNEINNPLSAIIGLATSISGSSSEEKIRQMSKLIERQAAELNFQMTNIIMAAEIESGELSVSTCRIDMGSLVDSQVASLRHRTDVLGVQIETQIEEHLKFRTDANSLQIIVLNLLANAIEFCGPDKTVIIQACKQDDRLELTVRDFGPGIQQGANSEMFQRFYQGETGLRKSHGGHGLGLCIVKELTNHLNGKLTIHSSSGQGTTVKLVLPEMEVGSTNEDQLNFGNELLFAEGETM